MRAIAAGWCRCHEGQSWELTEPEKAEEYGRHRFLDEHG
jgi:hypothetical protein